MNARLVLTAGYVAICILGIATSMSARSFVIQRTPIFREGAWYGTIDDFRLVHLGVNYLDHGYLRRGFVGSWLHVFGVEDVAFAAWVLSMASLVVFFGILGWVAAGLDRDRRYFVHVAALVMVLGPAGIPQFISDIGRLDHLLLPLAALAALAGLQGRMLVSTGLLAGMILIHELALIAFAPLLLACNTIGATDRTDVRLGPATLPFSKGATAAILSCGLVLSVITSLFGSSAEAVALFEGAGEGAVTYGKMIWGPNSPVHMVSWHGLPSVLLMLYYGVLFCWLFAYVGSTGGRSWLIATTPLSCFLLNFVGVDAGRWATISTWAVLLGVMATEYANRGIRHSTTRIFPVFLAGGILLSLPIGPLGVVPPFSFALRLFGIALP